jgi:predicted  nucleic acid-binding Zn-ribbon protein
VDRRALSELRDLAGHDAELTAEADELRRRDDDVAAIRVRAEAIDAFFSSYANQQARHGSAIAAARADLAHRLEELAQADAVLARARDEDARIHAQHAVDRAHDHRAVAEATLQRAEGELAELEREAAALPHELAELERRAGGGVAGARGLIEWASHTHAELFVAAGQIATSRERLIREADELASMLLGEPTYGATIAQALARVEANARSVAN